MKRIRVATEGPVKFNNRNLQIGTLYESSKLPGATFTVTAIVGIYLSLAGDDLTCRALVDWNTPDGRSGRNNEVSVKDILKDW